jgi:tetratricopeptide (TPR) repeat protein
VDEVREQLASAVRGLYALERELGRGGMGLVYLARDVTLGRRVALKVLPPLGALSEVHLARFRREAEIAAGLSHPNVVPIYGFGGYPETPYIAMAYVEGESLADRLAREGPLHLADVLRIAREVGSALAHAHRQGVVHRDIKPSNILLERESGRALVADFGVARSSAVSRITWSGVAVGTPGYMAPEQASGAEVDARADQYSFALLIGEMLTGRCLAETLAEWPATAEDVAAALRGARPDTPAGLVTALVRAVSVRKADRFPDVASLLEAIAPPGVPAPARAPTLRRRWRFTAGAVALGVVAAVGGLVVLRPRRPAPARATGGAVALLPFAGDSAAADTLLPVLRYQLGGFPAVRVADRRVFNVGPGADPASPEVRQAALRAGAGWLLHGLIASTGTAREVLVRAVEARSGRVVELGRFRVPAMGVTAADSVLALVARSEVGRAIGVSRGSGRALASLEAVRAFNAGEEAFRHADYPQAIAAYGRVAALDSTFALARYKRFLAALQQEPSEAVVRSAVADIRAFVPRIGPLESRLLTAYLLLFDSADVVGAERRLQGLVAEDSTFLDGWFALGEVRYHYGGLAGLPPDSAEAAFQRALTLAPDAAPALMHLIPLAFWFGRNDEVRQLMARYLALDSLSLIARTIMLSRSAAFGSATERLRVLHELGSLDERVLEYGAINGATVMRSRADLELARLAFEALLEPSRSRRVQRLAANFTIAALLAQGRWSDIEQTLPGLQRRFPDDPDLPHWPAAAARLGFPAHADPSRSAAPGRMDLAHAPFGAFATGWLERYERGRQALARGDTTAALAAFAAQDLVASVADGAVRGPVWLARGRIAAARGERDRAISYLRRAESLLAYAEPPFSAVRDSARAERKRLGAVDP